MLCVCGTASRMVHNTNQPAAGLSLVPGGLSNRAVRSPADGCIKSNMQTALSCVKWAATIYTRGAAGVLRAVSYTCRAVIFSFPPCAAPCCLFVNAAIIAHATRFAETRTVACIRGSNANTQSAERITINDVHRPSKPQSQCHTLELENYFKINAVMSSVCSN